MKRILPLLMSVLMLFTAIPFGALKVNAEITPEQADEIYQIFYDAFDNCDQSYIDVSEYNITFTELDAIVDKILAENYFLSLYCAGLKRTDPDDNSYIESNEIVGRIEPLFAHRNPAKIKALLEKKLDEIFSRMASGLDDLQIALYLHDYICINYEYDTTYTVYDAYTMLETGYGVCAAYSHLYGLLLGYAGIESCYVNSESINHQWNAIKIDGNWYQVDVTWDDPLEDKKGRARHRHFLLSDEASNKLHFGDKEPDAVCQQVCNETSFDNLSWHKTDIPFAFSYGETYVGNDRNIEKIDLKTNERTIIYTFSNDKWIYGFDPNGRLLYYVDGYVSVASYKDRLFAAGEKTINEINPDGTVTVIHTVDEENDYSIFSIFVVGDTLYYACSGSIDRTLFSFEIPQIEESDLLGDVNGNGKLEAADYLLLKKAILGNFELDSLAAIRADYNGNGRLDTADYLMLKKAILAA